MNWVVFVSGITMATFWASGIFFFKFWRASKDRFFLMFCLACWLLAAERFALGFCEGGYTIVTHLTWDARSSVIIFRMLAFVLILLAVVEKNRKRS